MDTDIVYSSPSKLMRTLSQHHWCIALEHMLMDRRLYQEAGHSYDTDGNLLWSYFLIRKGDIVEYHTVCDKYDIHDIHYQENMLF